MNNQIIKINNTDLSVKELKGQRVVTFKDIDMLHERVEGTAKRNFNENKKHLIQNVDYFLIKGEELRELKQSTNFVLSNAKEITLITESGYLMLVKSLQDDLAWKVQRELVNNYFRVKEIVQTRPTCIEDVLIAQLQEMKAVKQTAIEAKEEAAKSREEIQAMNNKIEQKLSSREVAQMMEVRHSDLLRKVDNINKDFTQRKIAFSKYWVESSSPDNSGKVSREFLITKRGCEFLAHKTTGTKGNLFTDRYMDRFEQMKQQLTNPMMNNLDLAGQMINVIQSTQMMAQVVQGLNQGMGYIQQYVQDSIQAKDYQIDQAMELIGIRSRNVHSLTNKLKEVLFNKYDCYVKASDIRYINAKNKIFKEFKVSKWEEIPIGEYNSVYAYIEELI
ncbi:MAG: ORF6N domain-containing protein [Clostridium sp.]|uniref:Rha family transcriptional regulator n=1 Tax=Clostridium sp. TaxID=1506 RepID=UPI0025802035|nr:Rha family transcriptional regulator [Clostridium sp.]MBS6889661.1 ORF6N domain-containing protein [Clostridium sp.]